MHKNSSCHFVMLHCYVCAHVTLLRLCSCYIVTFVLMLHCYVCAHVTLLRLCLCYIVTFVLMLHCYVCAHVTLVAHSFF